MHCRLILDGAHEGTWNMAVDEVLLESVRSEQLAYLRFYCWSEPTLSLGYFQPYDQRSMHRSSLQCPVVRRLSGGGAIMHDREWTYSLALPVDSPLGKRPETVYERVNQATLTVLRRFGVTASTAKSLAASDVEADLHDAPFLCFERRSSGDLLLGNSPPAKIMGSAQRRRHGAILQHGSLLLQRSKFAPELLGIKDLLGSFDDRGLIVDWAKSISDELDLQSSEYTLSVLQRERIEHVVAKRFANDAWTRRR